MDLALALLAVVLAAAALLAALRTERHVRRLARALAREWGIQLEQGEAPRRAAELAAGAEELARLRHAVQRLEQQARERELARPSELPDRPAAAPAAGGAGSAPAGAGAAPRQRLAEHLRSLGYEDVVVLPGEGPGGALRYEAREQGLPRKGSARVLADGRVSLSAAPVRAFP